jgi:hypothetical protein
VDELQSTRDGEPYRYADEAARAGDTDLVARRIH